MNTFIDEVLNTLATDGVVKYTITPDNGEPFTAQISLATPVTTQGTEQNKTFYDSIRNDLNSRLLTSHKASQAQAEAGTDNTNYMTALQTKRACFAQRKVRTYNVALSLGAWNYINFSDYINANTQRLLIIGQGYVSGQTSLTYAGSSSTKNIGVSTGLNLFKLDFSIQANSGSGYWCDEITYVRLTDGTTSATPTTELSSSNFEKLNFYPRETNNNAFVKIIAFDS